MQRDALISAHIGLPPDPAGIVLVERIEELDGAWDDARKRWRTRVRYAVRQIERTGAKLPEVAGLVEGLCSGSSAGRLSLLVNVTSCGRPPVDMMLGRRLRPIPIVTNNSDAARRGRGSVHVPAKDMLAQLSILMAERRLVPFGDVPGHADLGAQLREFTDKPKRKTALDPWREDETGELVMALALAVWWGETRLSSLVKQPPPPRKIEPVRWMPTFLEAVQISRKARLASGKRI